MGSYTELEGDINVKGELTLEYIEKIEKELGEYRRFSIDRKITRHTLLPLTKDCWKNFREESSLEYVEEIVRAFCKYNISITGKLRCRNEDGTFWKVVFTNTEAILYEGVPSYKESKNIKIGADTSVRT